MNECDQRVVAVDFDAVIAEYTGWQGNEYIGKPLEGVAKCLTELRERGWHICVWTARDLEETRIRSYCEQNAIPIDSINCVPLRDYASRKVAADVYLDDRGMQFVGKWTPELIEEIDSFHPYWEDTDSLEDFVPQT